MTDYKPVVHSDTPVVHKTKDVKTPVVVTELAQNKVPDGAISIEDLKPGYGPLEGSPDPNDPTKLANPNNPISYITRPVNPSNPANMPAMQSEKPASEVRIYEEQLLKANPKLAEERAAANKKAEEEAEAKAKKEADTVHKDTKK